MGEWFGGILTGGLVSVLALGTLSVISEQPAGVLPPIAPLVDAPGGDVVEPDLTGAQTSPLNTPVGAMTIEAPQTPALPDGEAGPQPAAAPAQSAPDAAAPPADTDPLDVPDVTSVEGAMDAPAASDFLGLVTQPMDPVFPNPQSLAPQTPDREADLAVSTVPATPVAVVVPEPEDDLFIVDLTAPTIVPEPAQDAAPINALARYGAAPGDVGDLPVMSFVLVDDGDMSAALAALAGLPFGVTIGLDPDLPQATALMEKYRAEGYEVVALAKLPDGTGVQAVADSYDAVFEVLPETIGLLDLGDAGLQADVDVTAEAMSALAAQGRGYITASPGLNMAVRAALAADVPAVVVSRDLDGDDQDARVVRRFVEQAVFRARQGSDVVLVGRMRAETISALILWAAATQEQQVAVVPVSAILAR